MCNNNENTLYKRANRWAASCGGLPIEVSLAFGAAVFAAMSLTRTDNFVAAIWPANGILLAGLLLAADASIRTKTLALSFAANVLVCLAQGEHLAPSLGYTIANTSEAFAAFWFLRWWKFGNFTEVNSFLKFCVVCGCAAPMGPSLWGAFVISQTFAVSFGSAWLTWFSADSLGLLIVTPVFVLLSDKAAERRKISAHSLIAHYGPLLLATIAVFSQTRGPLLFLITPFTALIAFQFGVRHAALSTFIVTALAVAFTYSGLGPAALTVDADAALKVSVVQLFCLVNLFTSVSIAAAVSERDKFRRHAQALSEEARRDKEKFFAALNSMSHGVCLFDAEQRIVMRSDSFLGLYSLTPEQVPVGQSFDALLDICRSQNIAPGIECPSMDLSRTGDIDQTLTNGRCIHLSQRPMPDGGMICTYTDVTAQREAEDQLIHRTLHDSLTGLPNRRLLVQRLKQAVASSKRGERSVVMLLDVDHFKEINDTLGHAAGDQLLGLVASRLKGCIRDSDTAARLGGDEFAILVRCEHDHEGSALAERILSSINGTTELEGKEVQIGMSIGIAELPADGADVDTILKAADVALYAAKRDGRNRYALHNNARDQPSCSPRNLERDLKTALSNGELFIDYQPIISEKKRAIVGAEALVRWRHPTLGLIAPAAFIPVAEKTNLICKIGDWVLETACREASVWPSDLKVAVNLSKRQLCDERLAERVADILAQTAMNPGRLELEVTETAVFDNPQAAKATLARIRALGVSIAIDDFGVGSSVLSCLKDLPITRVKIDRAFISDLPDDDRARAILVAITSLARTLGISTTAEGIETEAQRALVSVAGCEELQGFLLGRPISAQQLFQATGSVSAA